MFSAIAPFQFARSIKATTVLFSALVGIAAINQQPAHAAEAHCSLVVVFHATSPTSTTPDEITYSVNASWTSTGLSADWQLRHLITPSVEANGSSTPLSPIIGIIGGFTVGSSELSILDATATGGGLPLAISAADSAYGTSWNKVGSSYDIAVRVRSASDENATPVASDRKQSVGIAYMRGPLPPPPPPPTEAE